MTFILNFIGLKDHTIHIVGGGSAVMQGQITQEAFIEQHKPAVLKAFIK